MKLIRGTRYSSFGGLGCGVLGFPVLKEKKKKKKNTKLLFPFSQACFFLSLQMESCLPPALSPRKTNTPGSQAFARVLDFLVVITFVIIPTLLYYTTRRSSTTDTTNTSKEVKAFYAQTGVWLVRLPGTFPEPGESGCPGASAPRMLVRRLQKTLGGLVF